TRRHHTLFPYTTLFRSNLFGQLRYLDETGEHWGSSWVGEVLGGEQQSLAAVLVEFLPELRFVGEGGQREVDHVAGEQVKRGLVRSEEHTFELQSRENLV